MPSARKYFILTDALPASEIPHILGRTVSSKLLPHQSYAPIDTNPDALIPSLLPSPVSFGTNRDFYSNTSSWNLAGGLAELAIAEQSWSAEKGVTLESETVSSYQMGNTLNTFRKLMAFGEYDRDVRDLLVQNKGRGYFVTGFLTAKSGTLTTSSTKSQNSSLQLTAPLLQALGVSLITGTVGNPQITPGYSKSNTHESTRKIIEEVIFAVSYDVIRTSVSVDLDSKGWLKRSIVNGGPKRVKSRHQAFGNQPGYSSKPWDPSHSDDEDESGSENEEGRQVDDEPGEIEFVDSALVFEEDGEEQTSFQLSLED